MSTSAQQFAPAEPEARWRLIGPGLVVAATGVGAADLVATLIAGQKYGYALLWAVVIGCLMKIVLVEGAGRYSLATGNTIYEGWSTLGRWTTWYFGPYIVIWGFVYGAAAMAGTGLPLHSRRGMTDVMAGSGHPAQPRAEGRPSVGSALLQSGIRGSATTSIAGLGVPRSVDARGRAAARGLHDLSCVRTPPTGLRKRSGGRSSRCP